MRLNPASIPNLHYSSAGLASVIAAIEQTGWVTLSCLMLLMRLVVD
jgi:hypothetical protein